MLFGGGVRGARGGEEGRQREEVARPRGAVGDEGEDLGDEALLYTCVLKGYKYGMFLCDQSQHAADREDGGSLTSCV